MIIVLMELRKAARKGRDEVREGARGGGRE